LLHYSVIQDYTTLYKSVQHYKTLHNNIQGYTKTLKNIFPTKATKSGKVKSLEKDGTMYTTPEEISNLFNEHFVAVANIIKSNNSTYPELTKLENFVRLQKGINPNNLSIPTVTESEVLELIRSLPSHVVTGLDRLSSHLLKIITPAIAPSLTKIFNCSLINGTVPNELKLARVTPIHKQGIKDNPDNYRPISVLSVLSKILEKHVCKHLMAYFTEHGLLHKYQAGFRTNHSCETILLKLTDDWLEAMDSLRE
jgi:hypothetical protein